MMSIRQMEFSPREGALLDLESLKAIAAGPGDLVAAWLAAMAPDSASMILDGMEPVGELSQVGPPGTRRMPDVGAGSWTITKGTALITDESGRRHVLRLSEDAPVRWPTQDGPPRRGVLALVPKMEAVAGSSGLAVAREELGFRIGFIKMEMLTGQAKLPAHVLPLAMSVGNARDWSTDIRRVWQPTHPAVRALVERLTGLEDGIWTTPKPKAATWDTAVIGDSWVRYQTMGVAAIQAARFHLETHALSTFERVRLLSALRRQLKRANLLPAVESLSQLAEPSETADPYRVLSGADD